MRLAFILVSSLLPCVALAQPVQQSGGVTPGHAAMWTTTGVVQDAGTAAAGKLTTLGITAPGYPFCINSGPITGPYTAMCFGLNSNGAAITVNNFGGATIPNSITLPPISSQTFTNLFASPPPLGNVTPNTVAATTLSASGTVSGAGFTAWAASPPPIGSTAANTGAFTTLSSTGNTTLGSSATAINIGNSGSTTLVNGQTQTNALYTGLNRTVTVSGSQTVSQKALEAIQVIQGTASSGIVGPVDLQYTDTVNMTGGSAVGNGVNFLSVIGYQQWHQSTAYTSGTTKGNGGRVYTETVASCTSGSGGGPTGTGTGISDGSCSWNYVSPDFSGSRTGISSTLNINGSMDRAWAGGGVNWVSNLSTATINANQGGTAPTGASTVGFIYAGSDQMWCQAGATSLGSCVGREIDVGIFTGASAANRFGLHVVGFGNLQGNDFDGAVAVNGGAAPFGYAYEIGGGTSFATIATGTVLGYNPGNPISFSGFGNYVNPVAALGVDLSGVELSTALIRGTGGTLIDGAGVIQAQSLKISTSGAITTLDVTGGELNTVAVPGGGTTGTNYRSTDHLYDPVTGSVLGVTLNGSNQIIGYTIVTKGHYVGSAPGNPVALLGGTGTGATVNMTWTAGTTIGFGTTSATAINIGNASANTVVGSGSALATNATTGFLQIATMAGAPTGNCGGAAGKACVVVDTTNKKLCYNVTGTTWECSAAFTP